VVEYLLARPNVGTRQAQLRQLLREIMPVFLSFSDLERYATVRRQIRPPQGPGLIWDMDSLIAATALVRGLTVVTMDADFSQVPGLSVMLLDRRTLATA
jgi:predicted nucleic acid-binding protein